MPASAPTFGRIAALPTWRGRLRLAGAGGHAPPRGVRHGVRGVRGQGLSWWGFEERVAAWHLECSTVAGGPSERLSINVYPIF